MNAPLITQKNRVPTRKVAAGGIAGLAFPMLAGMIASYMGGVLPDVSEVCTNEVAMGVLVWGSMQAQGLVSTATSYMTKERA